MAGAFNGGSQSALMQSASPGLPSWADLTIFGDEAAQHISAFIIDADILVCAELADLGSRYKAARTRKSLVFIGHFF